MRLVALAGVVWLATSSGTSSHASVAGHWKRLYRPLQVPRIAEGTPCPVSRVDPSVDFAGFGIGPGLGTGPAYPVGLADGTLVLSPASRFASRRWMGQKVLWFVHPSYRGPILVRGRQLDGPHRVRFERGAVPPLELRIKPAETVWWNGQPDGSRGQPSYTRLRSPGCYGFQVDGVSFSYTVVFRAAKS